MKLLKTSTFKSMQDQINTLNDALEKSDKAQSNYIRSMEDLINESIHLRRILSERDKEIHVKKTGNENRQSKF